MSEQLPTATRELLQSYYLPDPDDVPSEARKLLEEYSKIPSEEVLPHVLRVVSLPCIVHFQARYIYSYTSSESKRTKSSLTLV